MLFHSIHFLQLFVVTFVLYWSLRSQRLRLWVLLLASVYFYVRWNPWLVSLVIGSAALGYRAGIGIADGGDARARRRFLMLGVGASLGLLAFFKYTNFLIGALWPAFVALGAPTDAPHLAIVLPLGISFFTFETVSYVTDVHRRTLPAERNLLDYTVFLIFFPHLVAGPIVRPGYFLPQLRVLQTFDWRRLELGARLFLLGFVKKAVIADNLAHLVDPVYAAPAGYGSAALWIATVAYAIQIYCDFSGYSDMAIGCAHAFGLRLPTNFDLPYLSQNVAEFWRRWHISLSTWLRDYLYISLGGNRGSRLGTYRNLLITMLLGGLWHGAAWSFVLWGLYHGLLLAIHRALPWPAWLGRPILAPLRVAATFFCVCLGWALFRAQSLSDAGLIVSRLLAPAAGATLAPDVVALFATIVGVVFLAQLFARFVDVEALARRVPAPLAAGTLAAVALLAQLLVPDAGGAFIYFQF